MKQIVQDFSTHPLVPGSILACLLGDPQSRKLHPLDDAQLRSSNKMSVVDVLAYFQDVGMVSEQQADQIIDIDARFLRGYKELHRMIPEIAEVTGCNRAAVEKLAHALFSAKLMAEYLEIATPPQLSYEKTTKGTVDLLEALFESFRTIVGGAWSVFFPRGEFSLVTDASAQFWTACLYSAQPEEMLNGFIGLYRRPHRERLLALNRGYRKEKGVRLHDAITDYLDSAQEKVSKLHDAVADSVKEGLDRPFQEISRILNTLEFPPLLAYYYDFLVREVCDAFSSLDNLVTSKENRFIQYLLKQTTIICETHHPLTGPRAGDHGLETLDQLLGELDELVGIVAVKEKVRQMAHFARLQQMRVAEGLNPIPASYHSVYTGNPGTGKTTVARLMGRIYKSLGVLKRGHLVECDRSALVAEYVGQTAVKTNTVIDSALDGILFIDEAYALVREKEDYGREAIDILLKRMEDNRDRLIVIVAGYPEPMKKFINANPGLHSRFTRFVDFPDYTPQELCRIFTQMCRKHGLTLTPELVEKILHHFTYLHTERKDNFGNARLVRNCFESVIYSQASRLAASGSFDTNSLTKLLAEDLSTPAEQLLADYRRTRIGYILRCPQCGEVYSWSPELQLTEAQCGKCGRIYNGEFGQLQT
ncbi:MAG: AAA family ATPase [Verrucomicrobiota bacterium]